MLDVGFRLDLGFNPLADAVRDFGRTLTRSMVEASGIGETLTAAVRSLGRRTLDTARAARDRGLDLLRRVVTRLRERAAGHARTLHAIPEPRSDRAATGPPREPDPAPAPARRLLVSLTVAPAAPPADVPRPEVP